MLFALGDVLFGVYEHVLHKQTLPSPADGFYLAAYPVLAAGMWLLVRQRSTGRDWESLIDASIVTVALGVIAWELLMVPYTHDHSLSFVEKLVSMAYPLGDILLLAVAARLLLGTGVRTVSYGLLGASVICLLVADPLYTYFQLKGSYATGNALDSGWIFSYILWGAAALHPSMRVVSDPAPETAPQLTPFRLTLLLAVAALTAPAVLAFRPAQAAIASATVLFLLVLARLTGIVRRHERAVERESRLRMAAATLVAATSDEEIHRAAVETAMAFAGSGAARAKLSLETPQGTRVADTAGEGSPAQIAEATFPLVIRGERRGELEVRSVEELRIEDRNGLETLAAQVALALETVARAREQAERASEARFRSLVQNSSDVIAIVAPDTTVRWMTPSAETTFGHAAEALVEQRFADLVHPDDAPRAADACLAARAAAACSPARGAGTTRRTGRGSTRRRLSAPRLDDETIGGLVLTTRDVTERKQLEAADAERARVRDMFSRFVPEAVVDELLSAGGRACGWAVKRGTGRSCSPTCATSRASRDAAGAGGDRGDQPVPLRADRHDHGARRDDHRLSRRRDHGRLRRADRAGRSRRPRARRVA